MGRVSGERGKGKKRGKGGLVRELVGGIEGMEEAWVIQEGSGVMVREVKPEAKKSRKKSLRSEAMLSFFTCCFPQ